MDFGALPEENTVMDRRGGATQGRLICHRAMKIMQNTRHTEHVSTRSVCRVFVFPDNKSIYVSGVPRNSLGDDPVCLRNTRLK